MNNVIYLMGEKPDEIMLIFGLSNEEETEHQTVISKFDSYFASKSNIITLVNRQTIL